MVMSQKSLRKGLGGADGLVEVVPQAREDLVVGATLDLGQPAEGRGRRRVSLAARLVLEDGQARAELELGAQQSEEGSGTPVESLPPPGEG
jgi:hypothetical protein